MRAVRHLEVFGRHSWLCFESRTVDCPECGIGAEALSFVEPGHRTTLGFRRFVGTLCHLLPNKQVTEHVHLAEDTVRAIDKEYLAARYPPPDLSELRVIAVDEIAYRTGHNYLTLVLDYATGEVRVATMVSSHFDGLMAYHDYPITNGPLEGLNTKINVLRRSRHGFRDLVYFGLKIRQVSIERSIPYVSNLPNLDGEREKVA